MRDMGNALVANRYELIGKVGKGSFGEVYIGYDKKNNEASFFFLFLSQFKDSSMISNVG